MTLPGTSADGSNDACTGRPSAECETGHGLAKSLGRAFSIESLMRSTATAVISGITGIAAADRAQLALSVGHVMQAMLSGRFLSQVEEEWKQLRAAGRIKEDYAFTAQSRADLSELLRYLDSEVPDEARLDALRKVFIVAASEEITTRDSHLPQQYMAICRHLAAGELLVLAAAHATAEVDAGRRSQELGASEWLQEIATRSGLKHPELVEVHERSLVEKNLLTARRHSDRSGVKLGPWGRLTALGHGLCEFISHHEALSKSAQEPRAPTGPTH